MRTVAHPCSLIAVFVEYDGLMAIVIAFVCFDGEDWNWVFFVYVASYFVLIDMDYCFHVFPLKKAASAGDPKSPMFYVVQYRLHTTRSQSVIQAKFYFLEIALA